MKKFLYILIIIYAFIASCNNRDKKQIEFNKGKNLNSYTLKIKDTLIFNSDSTHAANSNFFSVKNHILLQQNNLDNSIYAFDLDSHKKLYKLSLPEFGPEKIGKIQGFLFENTDSIYLVSPLDNKIKLIDTTLKIKKEFNIGENIKSKIASFSQMPLLKFDSLFFLNCLPDYDFYNDPRFLIFNKNSKKIIQKISINNFIKKNNYDLLYSLNSFDEYSTNRIAISIGVSGQVFIYDILKKNKIDSMYVASDNFINTEPLEVNQSISIKERLERSYYKSIFNVFVEKKHFLLRTTSLSIEPFDVEGNLKSLYDKQQSVIIYDVENREKVGEYFLPKGVYDFKTGFIYKNRLYFLLNNPNSKQQENLMQFVGYEISTI